MSLCFPCLSVRVHLVKRALTPQMSKVKTSTQWGRAGVSGEPWRSIPHACLQRLGGWEADHSRGHAWNDSGVCELERGLFVHVNWSWVYLCLLQALLQVDPTKRWGGQPQGQWACEADRIRVKCGDFAWLADISWEKLLARQVGLPSPLLSRLSTHVPLPVCPCAHAPISTCTLVPTSHPRRLWLA